MAGASMARLRRWGPPAVLLAALVGGWQTWVLVAHTPAYVLPSPARIAGAFVDSAPLLPGHVGATVLEAVGGLVVGAATGGALAVLVASVPVARRTLEPLLVASQTIPMVVLAPLLALWFGIGVTPKIVVVALITFFPVVVSTTHGLTATDPELVDLVRSMGATHTKALTTVRFPAAVPAFFSGLRIAAAYAVAGAVIGELVAGERGLGIFINRSRSSFRVDRIFVAVAVISILSALLFALVGAAARAASPWQHLDRLERESS